MFTAKKAKKLSEKSVDQYTTMKEVEGYLSVMAQLGFSNAEFDAPKNKEKIIISLKRRGFRVFDSKYPNENSVEVEW